MVYVISKSGKPLMPTKRHGKVRRLLKDGRAKVIRRTPFTIQLLYETTEYTQPVTLGVDPGYENIGLSAVTEDRELLSAEAKARTDIPKLLSRRRQYRRSRRSRKTRYRKPRFSNRKSSKPKGWVPPSVENRIDFHLKLIRLACSILPVTEIRVEVSQFDTQKLKNPDIDGVEYQQGDQLGYRNVREYVFWRDGHTCQHCRGKSGDRVLQVHHLESRQTGGDRPGNLLTLCASCHREQHRVGLPLPKPEQGLRGAASMNTMRWELWERAKELGIPVIQKYGYQTKHDRIRLGLAKSHTTDAYLIAGGTGQERTTEMYDLRQVRKQNRKLYRGKRSEIRNHVGRLLHGYRQWDKVRYRGEECFVKGRRSSGYFSLSDIYGKVSETSGKKLTGVRHSYLSMVEMSNTLLKSRRKRHSSPLTERGILPQT